MVEFFEHNGYIDGQMGSVLRGSPVHRALRLRRTETREGSETGDTLKIVVEGIPAPGREIPFGMSESWAVEAAKTSLERPPGRLKGSIMLNRANANNAGGPRGVVIVDVKADVGAPTICDRCGEECELAVATEIRLLYAPEESQGAAYDGISLGGVRPAADPATRPGVELHAEDLDIGWYAKGELPLGDVLTEALSLAIPTRVVCADRAECDKRTDILLAAARGTDGPFAALGALRRGPDKEN